MWASRSWNWSVPYSHCMPTECFSGSLVLIETFTTEQRSHHQLFLWPQRIRAHIEQFSFVEVTNARSLSLLQDWIIQPKCQMHCIFTLVDCSCEQNFPVEQQEDSSCSIFSFYSLVSLAVSEVQTNCSYQNIYLRLAVYGILNDSYPYRQSLHLHINRNLSGHKNRVRFQILLIGSM